MPGPNDVRFLLDVMLGRLATYLRMCGYDAAYALDRDVEDDDRLREIAADEERVLLTRDVTLAARTEGAIGLDSLAVTDQLRELRDRGFELGLDESTRCSLCNGVLEEVPTTRSTPVYAPDPETERVWRCVDCGQFFWKGSHWDDVAETIETL